MRLFFFLVFITAVLIIFGGIYLVGLAVMSGLSYLFSLIPSETTVGEAIDWLCFWGSIVLPFGGLLGLFFIYIFKHEKIEQEDCKC